MSNLNGGVIIPNAAQREQGYLMMRMGIATQIVGHLAACDYQRAYIAAVEAADPMNTAERGTQLDLQINLNSVNVSKAALIYAEQLLADCGFAAPAEKEACGATREPTEWEKQANR